MMKLKVSVRFYHGYIKENSKLSSYNEIEKLKEIEEKLDMTNLEEGIKKLSTKPS